MYRGAEVFLKKKKEYGGTSGMDMSSIRGEVSCPYSIHGEVAFPSHPRGRDGSSGTW